MERLYRTLGESVPPELVFREAEKKRTLQGRGRSKDDNDILKASRVGWGISEKQADISTSLPSSRSLEHFPDHQSTTAPSPTTELTPGIPLGQTPSDTQNESRPTSVSPMADDYGSASPDGHRKHSVPSLSESELTNPPPDSVSNIPSPAIPAEEVKASSDTHHSRGKSEQIFANGIPKSYLMTRSSSLKVRLKPSEGLFPSSQRSPAPFAPYFEDTNLLSTSAPTGEKSSGVRRKERKEGWSGEWNLSDMQDVIRRLRDLK
ncbi:hypothetical protein PILCRDRAFT_829171 [Piloderma croceum F 1598]|uniref:Uncharacterized protein n=1 Tax=Piloderma croceum (strain F 1598) TaxID=765440 RepID=A0A0C3EZS7_PILCF|nr:hypothetical protein PILCRDRAFT_829171 [Piloderma croceum F 1598]